LVCPVAFWVLASDFLDALVLLLNVMCSLALVLSLFQVTSLTQLTVLLDFLLLIDSCNFICYMVQNV
jgi:hypothetical protein